MKASQVSACLVTRGDVDLDPILATLERYDEVIVWDNSQREDLKVYGRYAAMEEARNEVCYLQDDDTIFRHHDELLSEYEPGLLVANWGHGECAAGFDDLALVCGGALVERSLSFAALDRYLEHFPLDDDFLNDCDFIAGMIPHKHVQLGFEIRDVAYNGKRLADEPWQREAKMRVTNRARWLRDHGSGVAPVTDSMSMEMAYA